MNTKIMRQVCLDLGLVEPISIEVDGTVWTGVDPDRVYPDMKPILAKYERVMKDEPRRAVEALRKAAYAAEADPLFFKFQRGDATEAEWLAAVQSIKSRFPYPA